MPIRKASEVILINEPRTASPTDIILTDIWGTSEGVTVPSMAQITNLHVVIDVTAVAATPSVQPAILTPDKAAGDFYDLLGSIAPITAAGKTILRVGRDMEPAAGLAARDFIPQDVLLRFTHADADSITYSVFISAEFDMVQ